MFSFHTQLRLGVLLFMASLLFACSHTPQSNQLAQQPFSPHQAELVDVPFFPQTEYQCGPAALATVMQYRGIAIEPEALTEQVYTPEKQGSLQVEMIAAARRQGLMPYLLAPQLSDLLTEVAAGNPVLVMQNLGYNWKPFWHYAVVVGFDLDAQQVILRSGTNERWQTTLKTFERTWARSEHWAVVIVEADNIPQTAQLAAWLQTAYAAEQTGQFQSAQRAYQAAVKQWPTNKQPGIALANLLYQQERFVEADQQYADLIATFADEASLYNNRAYTLTARQCHQAAIASAACAAKLAPDDPNIQQTFKEMLLQEPVSMDDCPIVSCQMK